MNTAVVIWLIAAVLFGVIEGVTVALVSVWMAVGAIGAAAVSAFGGSIMMQIIVFLVLSAVLLLATVPLSSRFRKRSEIHTNADRLIGAEAVVLHKIDRIDNKGQVKALGQIWSASAVDQEEFEVGEKVVVKAIEGVRAIVEAADHRG